MKGSCLLKSAELQAAFLVVDSDTVWLVNPVLGSTAAEKEKSPLNFVDWVKGGKMKKRLLIGGLHIL